LKLYLVFIANVRDKIPYFSLVVQLYGGVALILIFSLLFGLNIYVWQKVRINYVFIFEFDARDYLSFHEYIEVSNQNSKSYNRQYRGLCVIVGGNIDNCLELFCSHLYQSNIVLYMAAL